MEPEIRKIVTTTEEIYQEGAGALDPPLRVATAIAVVKNPFAGEYASDLGVLSGDYSASLGPRLSKLAVEALGSRPKVYGKAALVGLRGEIRHGSAIIHTRLFGDALRELSDGRAPVSSAEKRGAAGASIDVALRNVQDTGTLDGLDTSHLFQYEVRIPDAPADNEIVVIAAVADGGRPEPRPA